VKCTTCGRTENDHPFKHPFTKPGENQVIPDPPKKKERQQGQTLVITPAPDLVLRGLLLRLGIITPEQLEAVERELNIGVIGVPPVRPTDVLQSDAPPNS
jgi:hypothetical protein